MIGQSLVLFPNNFNLSKFHREESKIYFPRFKSVSNINCYLVIRKENNKKCKNDNLKASSFSKKIIRKIHRKYTYEAFKTPLNEYQLRQEMIRKILIDRVKASYAIQIFYRKYKIINNKKKEILIERISQMRSYSAITIQKNIRMYIIRKSILSLVCNKQNYVFLYRFEKQSDYYLSKPVNLKLKLNNNENTYSFVYNKYIDAYYILFSKNKVIPRRIKVNFLVDDKPIIDPRFEVDCIKSIFYNIIDSSIIKKTKPIQLSKEFERMFEINYSSEKSVSDVSISEIGDIDRTFIKTISKRRQATPKLVIKQPVKSILKKFSSKTFKRVSFDL